MRQSAMYCKHFGFEQLPFGVTSDPQFFYVNPANAEALSALALEVKRGSGFVLLTGETGVGKTTLLRKLIVDLPERVRCAFVVVKGRLSFLALLRSIVTELGISPVETNQKALLEQLGNYVQTQFSQGCAVALIFDEAQAMTDEVLMQLSSLRDSGNAMSIVLVGNSDLESRLNNLNLRSLKERITSMRRLPRLKNVDIAPYINSKLKRAGLEGNAVFEREAIEKIVKWSNGIPRLIDVICDNALLVAYRSSMTVVTRSMVEQVVENLCVADRLPGAARKAPVEIVHAADAAETVANFENEGDGRPAPAAQQAKKSIWQKPQFANRSQVRRRIGALVVGVVSLSSVVVFNSRMHDASVPRAAVDLESSRRAVLAINTPIEPIRFENSAVATQTPQPASMVLPASTVVQQDETQNQTGDVGQQNHAEVAKVDKPAHAAPEQIYRVIGASFVRSRPAANAEIIETLQPGIRVAILSRSGEFIRVRSLGDATVLGFVHQEDAFFERIQ